MLLNHVGEHFANSGKANLAAVYFKKAFEAEERGNHVRQTVINHEHLSNDQLHEQAGDEPGSERLAISE